MRVLTIIDSLDASGGAERSLAALAPELVSAGIDLHVAYLRDRPRSIAEQLVDSGAAVHSLVGRGGRASDTLRTAKLVRAVRPDLVHTTLFEADQAGRIGARATGRPVVTSLVNVAYGTDQSTSPDLARWKVRAAQTTDALTARAAVRFHAITAHVADVMAARLRIPRDRIDVIYRGRDPHQLGRRTAERRARIRRDLGLNDQQPVVLAVGRQEWQKGHDVLIAALPELARRWPSLTLLIAGRPGRQSADLEQAVARTGLSDRVRVLGFRDDVAELLCGADVLAFPSRWEGLGSSLLEAMALEIPIVASGLPAVREVLSPAEARLVAPAEPDLLAAAIGECLADPTGATRRTEAARHRFLREFTVQASASSMTAFYERALQARRGQ
ncbi:MAG: glycosyltransferase [Acidimicrobiia bacterium]|nr:glycosyltransferase [Acidimicrobiia bacterium]